MSKFIDERISSVSEKFSEAMRPNASSGVTGSAVAGRNPGLSFMLFPGAALAQRRRRRFRVAAGKKQLSSPQTARVRADLHLIVPVLVVVAGVYFVGQLIVVV